MASTWLGRSRERSAAKPLAAPRRIVAWRFAAALLACLVLWPISTAAQNLRLHFDEGSGTTVLDSSGLGNDGSFGGAAAWTAGVSGSALDFTGSADLVLVPDASSLDIAGPITIAAWLRPSVRESSYVIKKARKNAVDGYEVGLSSSGAVDARFNQVSAGDVYEVSSTTPYPFDGATWFHVAVTFDGADLRLYFDGVLENTLAAPGLVIAGNDLPLAIGGQDNGVKPYDGAVDDVLLYDRALGAAEIAALVSGNGPPMVDAGPDQTIRLPSDTVALDATVSDDGQPIPVPVVSWSGPPGVSFADPGAVDTVATFPGPGSYVLQLTADDTDRQASDTLTVVVEPVAVLDAIAVTPASVSLLLGQTQVFTASGTDQYGDSFPVSPGWSATGGVIDAGGTYTAGATIGSFLVVATDGAVSGQANVTIARSPPMAEAGGPYAGQEGTGIPVDGSGSTDADDDIVTWQWDFDGDGSYDDASGATAVYPAAASGVYTIGLRVTDSDGAHGSDTAAVTVANLPPVAEAGGPYLAEEGSPLSLDGSASSDPGNDIVSWEWDLDEDSVYDDASGASVAFDTSTPGDVTVALRVTDADGANATDTASVTVTERPPGFVGVWRFDEGSGTDVQDDSGLGNDGSFGGTAAWTPGVSGSALDFTGSADLVLVPDAPSLDIAGPITIAAWLRPSVRESQYVIKKARKNAVDGYEVGLSSSGAVDARFNQVSAGDVYEVSSTTPYPFDGATWFHVAVTFDGADLRLYFDGVLENTLAAPGLVIAGNDLPLAIGAQDNGVKPYDGAVDDVLLYDRALSAVEVAALVSGNGPPTVDAGPDRSILLPTDSVALDATVSDDGQLMPLPVVSWSGPPEVSFADPGAVDTVASFSGPGSYLLQLEASDGEFSVSDTTTVTVYPAAALTSIELTPSSGSVVTGGNLGFSAIGRDQLGDPFPTSPQWVAAGGSIAPSGPATADFTAGSSAGSFTVTAFQGGVSSSAVVSVTQSPAEVWPTLGWDPATPAEMGMDQPLLEQARDYALAGGGKGMISRGGRVVMSWGEDSRSALRSATKSVGVTTLGLAMQDGLVDLDDAAELHLPSIGLPPSSNAATGWLDDITLKQLATQTAGFENDGGYGDLDFQPGTVWQYSDGGPNWLADVLTVVYGQDLEALLFDRLFTPLGITSDDLTWRAHPTRTDPIQGIPRREFASGIRATPDAMARIGYLYLRRGRWDGQQIVPEGFVDLARRPVPGASDLPVSETADFGPEAAAHYGLLWWNNADGTLADVPRDAFFAYGIEDRLILVIPSLDIVAVRAGDPLPGSREPSFYTVLEPFMAPIARSVNWPPQVDAGPDATALLPQDQMTLAGSLTDDAYGGYPATTTWSVLSGPGTVAFDDPQALAATAAFSRPGSYLLALHADDGEFEAADVTSVTILATLEVIGSALGGSVTLDIEGVDVVVPTVAGWNAAQVAAALASAVDTDPALGALGVSARSEGATVAVAAPISGAVSADPGIQLGGVPVPGLAWPARVLLAAALVWVTRRR